MKLEDKLDLYLEATTTADVAKHKKKIGSKAKPGMTSINFSIKDSKAIEKLKKLKRSYEERGVTVVIGKNEGEVRTPPHLVAEIKGELEKIKGIEM